MNDNQVVHGTVIFAGVFGLMVGGFIYALLTWSVVGAATSGGVAAAMAFLLSKMEK